MEGLRYFSGRRLLLNEIPKEMRGNLGHPRIKHYPTMVTTGRMVQCLRCETNHQQSAVKITNDYETFYYCPSCIQLGRVQSNLSFYGSHWRPIKGHGVVTFAWKGQLTNSQKEVSDRVREVIDKKQSLLVHAVTGAGKTEMLFEGIHLALNRGWQVALVSPRVDVCLELFPRLQAVFPSVEIALLYGKQEQAYHYSSLVICTTHQLLRFYRAFDVLIVDEVDAFPYVDNQLLETATRNAKKKRGAQIMLSATSTAALEQQVIAGELEKALLPARFHGYALPVPEGVWLANWRRLPDRSGLPNSFRRLIERQLAMKRRTLIFCPTIDWLKKLTKRLVVEFPNAMIDSAHANDSHRYEKIKSMRRQAYDLFLTTTILERGVTFADIDVIVLGSNHRVYNQSSLIQIAGRVGRSSQAPRGNVYFIHDGWSQAMKGAIKEIRQLNRLAKKKGLIGE